MIGFGNMRLTNVWGIVWDPSMYPCNLGGCITAGHLLQIVWLMLKQGGRFLFSANMEGKYTKVA